MAHRHIAVACSQSKPSSPSPAPASQPAESQESFNLDNVSGSDKPAQVDRGDKIKVNDPDAIALPKVPTCYAPGHLAHISFLFLFLLDRYVLIRSHDFDSHDRLPVQQSHLVGNFIVPSFCMFPIVLFLW